MSLKHSSRPVRRPEYWMVLGAIVFVAVCFYGLRAAAVMGLAALTALLTDFFCLFLRGRSYRLVDLSNIGNALILVLMFPATIPFSIVILSTVFAVAVGSHVFGCRKDLLFPPAAVGYLFALICWKDSVLKFPAPGEPLQFFHTEMLRQESFSSLFNEKGSILHLHYDLMEMLIGAVPGAMGTGCIILLVLGIVILLCRKQLNLWAVLGASGFLLFPAVAGRMDLGILLTNMLLFSTLFFLADPSLMPCRSVLALLASYLTSLLAGFLIVKYHIEYAPIAAVILTCPLWRWMAQLDTKRTQHERVQKRQEVAADDK